MSSQIGERGLKIDDRQSLRHVIGEVEANRVVQTDLASNGHVGEEESGEDLGDRPDFPAQRGGPGVLCDGSEGDDFELVAIEHTDDDGRDLAKGRHEPLSDVIQGGRSTQWLRG
jgi:hypothetical protein